MLAVTARPRRFKNFMQRRRSLKFIIFTGAALPCDPPVTSPQGNGLPEALVNTFKRDYVNITPLSDATNDLGLIAGWSEGYNGNHPCSGRKMRSLREYIAAQTATA